MTTMKQNKWMQCHEWQIKPHQKKTKTHTLMQCHIWQHLVMLISDAMPYMATCSYGMSDVMPSLASSWMSSLTIKRK